MHFGFTLLVDDAYALFSCTQIDAAIEFVLLIVKFYGFASLFSLCGLMVAVSIAYTNENKGATSSNIFWARVGPDIGSSEPGKYRGGFIVLAALGFLLRP